MNNMIRDGLCVIIIGTVASGKTTVIKRLVRELPDAVMMQTYTTRAPRIGEKESGDRIFVTRAEFEEMIQNGEFIEYSEHFGHFYGSSRKIFAELMNKHQVVIANLNYAGARVYQKEIPNCLTIFLTVPENQAMARINKRGGMNKPELEIRLNDAKKELATAAEFDAVIDNSDGKLDRAVALIKDLIQQKLK